MKKALPTSARATWGRCAAILPLLAGLTCSPVRAPTGTDQTELAESLARELEQACPITTVSDSAARERCADALTSLDILRDRVGTSLRWGAQSVARDYDLTRSKTTLFNSRVLRRMYLSTFMFGAGHRVERHASTVVLRIPVRFRNELDPGDYPYPFWHAQAKWQSYERAQELLFLFQDGVLSGVLRSAEQDADRSHVERAWDGHWSWTSERGAEPRAALYQFLFSAKNPHVPDVERAYRAFEAAQRAINCTGCHLPANPAKINPLEMFSYPNQALSARHDIVAALEANAMPPATEGASAGIADAKYRAELLLLARVFAEAGDRALSFEGEPTPQKVSAAQSE